MKCPACKSDLQGGLIFDTFMEKYGDESKAIEESRKYGATKTTGHWGREIGIETTDYDGISFWKCPDCGAIWDGFTGKIKKSPFEKNTTKTEADGRVMIRCNKGLWSVAAPSEYEAMREAVKCYIQYAEDGEYDE